MSEPRTYTDADFGKLSVWLTHAQIITLLALLNIASTGDFRRDVVLLAERAEPKPYS